MKLSVLQKDASFALGLVRRRPFQVLVQVTNRCNMKCSFCDFWPNVAPKREELTIADYRRIADELHQLGCFLVSIEGGEPLIRQDLEQIIEAFAKHHIPALFTNGWYVDEKRARSLFDAGLVHASVSIDYADAAQHDAKRGIVKTTENAWHAVDLLKAAAPRGGLQVHIMTVLMQSNEGQIDALLQQSAARGVGHQFTLLSVDGYRRGKEGPDRLPSAAAAETWPALFERHQHVRFFSDYFKLAGNFLRGGDMPSCRAGLQSFNIDHVGNVSPCIERIQEVAGNVKTESLAQLHQKLVGRHPELASCQQCYTACRGFNQAMGNGGTTRGWLELASRMRSS
ncbi:MAG TPA: radical SAM protein [Polyangiaceae bacterium]|nr:radical SAM protein [Polyangiaceae bacterium]